MLLKNERAKARGVEEVQWLRNPDGLWGTTALQRVPNVPRSIPIGLCLSNPAQQFAVHCARVGSADSVVRRSGTRFQYVTCRQTHSTGPYLNRTSQSLDAAASTAKNPSAMTTAVVRLTRMNRPPPIP